ncbi:LysM peptidoglycan-binding domain-containing protein [Paeniglutamicibacter psychrophenolicus]|uniref:LysM peptidoglycan-binding domain-containing protein n=1 Tax=Paeniglutamicibacter psychrophenolicus TaxID=257454 RepID=UPI00277D6848|nr:LysM domain-containing protein [Paeniglutamicibacter psychrophenolicus]MDQ0095303.1 nucleoid-associated protein YgaU [Paeniglutamicibacter psychrophenolicus]
MRSQTARDTLALVAAAVLSLGMLGASIVLWRSLQERAGTGTRLDAWSLERLTGLAIGLLGAASVAWLLLCLALALAARLLAACGHRRRGAALAALVPGFVARVVLAGFGGSIVLAGCATATATAAAPAAVAAPLTPAQHLQASIGGQHERQAGPRQPEATGPKGTETELLSPGFIPHRVPLPLARLAGGTTRTLEEVVVRPGDSLWAIAARHLPSSAGPEDIAAAWPLWFAANRRLIGPDPDRLEVGMVLQAPRATSLKS